MIFPRLVFLFVAGCCLLRPSPLRADDPAPYVMEKHYSADVVVSTQDHADITSKTYVDDDKMRSDVATGGMAISIIVRRDKQKVYQLLTAQKMAMEMPFDPNRFSGKAAAGFGPKGKFELVGPDTVDGIACTKYKVTPEAGKETYFFWLDTAKKAPVAMADTNGTFQVRWKNFQAGPQDAALFEVPSDYTLMPAPGMPAAVLGGVPPAPPGNP